MQLVDDFKKNKVIYIGALIFLILLLVIFLFVDSKTIIGLVGVVIGGLISSITTIIINRTNYQKQLKLAALEKRLDAHQKAFSIWRRIVFNLYKDTIGDVVIEAQNWWENNCLYLGVKSRAAFFHCLNFAVHHSDMRKSRNREYDYKKEIKESWDTIMLPGKTLVEEVNLPSFGEEEFIIDKPLK